MSNVIVEKNKLDVLANAISCKSGEPVTMTLDEMVSAVDGIDTSTPTGNIDIAGAGVFDVANYATATVPQGSVTGRTASYSTAVSIYSVSLPNVIELTANVPTTPSTTRGYVTGASSSSMQVSLRTTAFSVNPTPTVSGDTVTIPQGIYTINGTATVASGTAGTPTATKGTVSNHSVTVTPSVTNQTGWITGSTKTGTGVTVSASELASGNKEITQNGSNIDVVGYSTVSVNVSGGGGSSVAVDTAMRDAGGDEYTAIFTGLKGEPTSFAIYVDDQVSPSATAVISSIVYDGSSTHIQTITNTSNAQVSYASSGVSYTYNSGTLTVTSSSPQFVDTDYALTYSYGGSSANIHTADVQVGSGATSITFTGLEDLPLAWYCIFKSNFSTSSGYQRVIFTEFDGNVNEHVAGLAMDSSAHPSISYWSYTYNGNGSLTISSTGTNQGGYFHQPGYYQLTYVIGEASPYEKVSKTYRASTTAQSEKIEPSTGYDAMSEVNVNIPAVTQTNLTAANIKSGTTVTISNGSTNLWSVTGTYSGGGGSANIATATMTNSSNQSTSIAFTLPSGRTPKAFFARLTSQIARNSNSRYYYVFDMRWDGSSTGGVAGNTFYMYNGTLTNVTSGYSYSQSGTTFTLSSTGSRSASPGSFYNGDYELVYIY